MEKRIELEKRGRPAEEITDLNLDNCRATQIEGLTDDFKNLESLSLINVGLTTLKGFPSLPNLRKLELSDNRISGSLNLLDGCPKLQYLNLSGNKIKDIDILEPLKHFGEMMNLDLFNCEVTNMDNYRDKLFELLPSLHYLDGYDRQNMEAEDEEEDGEEIDGEEDDEDEEALDDEDDDDDEDGSEVVDIDDDDDDENELDDDDDDGSGGSDSGEDVGLEYLQKDGLDEEEDGEDFEPADGAEEDDVPDEDEDEDDEGEQRGVKRKLEEEDA